MRWGKGLEASLLSEPVMFDINVARFWSREFSGCSAYCSCIVDIDGNGMCHWVSDLAEEVGDGEK